MNVEQITTQRQSRLREAPAAVILDQSATV
jgi:hypothetical protein